MLKHHHVFQHVNARTFPFAERERVQIASLALVTQKNAAFSVGRSSFGGTEMFMVLWSRFELQKLRKSRTLKTLQSLREACSTHGQPRQRKSPNLIRVFINCCWFTAALTYLDFSCVIASSKAEQNTLRKAVSCWMNIGIRVLPIDQPFKVSFRCWVPQSCFSCWHVFQTSWLKSNISRCSNRIWSFWPRQHDLQVACLLKHPKNSSCLSCLGCIVQSRQAQLDFCCSSSTELPCIFSELFTHSSVCDRC